MSIRVFFEGATEDSVVRCLEPLIGEQVIPVNVQGEANFPRAIRDRLGPALDEPGGARFVVLRDWDQGKELADVQYSTKNLLRRAFQEAGHNIPAELAPHPIHPNVFLFQVQQPSLRFALHVARPVTQLSSWQFTKQAIDDYVLALALLPPVMSRFVKEGQISATGEDIQNKVLRAVPDLFTHNGIPINEAKDLVGIYMATTRFLAVKRAQRPETFVRVVVDRALKHAEDDLKDILASLLATFQVVIQS